MAALSPIIPGAQAWPKFTRNKSEQFEARLSLVEVLESPSIFFKGSLQICSSQPCSPLYPAADPGR
jgi:phosphoribosylformylglycinamidine (FGAM) synthase-like amidotransferase family enzyme